MITIRLFSLCIALSPLAACGGDEPSFVNSSSKSEAARLILPERPSEHDLAQVEAWLESHRKAARDAAPRPETAAPSPASTRKKDRNRIETVERVTSDGRRILARELVGPNVIDNKERGLRWDEIEEIERATGRPYQEGDTIHGRAREVPRR